MKMTSLLMKITPATALVLSALCLPAAETKTYHETSTPATLSEWLDAKDGKVSVCFAVDKTTFSAKERLVVRCALRNNTENPMTILRPFGDAYYSQETGIRILGPNGPVSYHGPVWDYLRGGSQFMELPAHTVVDETLELPSEYFPGLSARGLYIIRYLFLSNGYPKQPAPENFWQGQVKTASVTILIQ
jgi:hypothetical protein